MDKSIRRSTAVLLTSMLMALPAFAHAAAAADTADFVRGAEFAEVTLSPDGRYLAALAPRPGQPQQNMLVILDAATGKPLRTMNSGSYRLISGYTWTGQNRIVGTVAMQLDGLDTPVPTGELYAINADGSRPINLFGYQASENSDSGIGQRQKRDAAAAVISTELADPGHILIATRPFSRDRDGTFTDIETLDVISGSTRRIGGSPARDARLIADHTGTVRAAHASEDGITTRLWTKADDRAPWQLRNDPATSGITLIPIGFNRDNGKLYVEGSQPDGPDAIELLDMASGKLARLYRGQFADPAGLLPTADGKDYYAVITADGAKGLHYLDGNSLEARLNRMLAPSFPGRLAYLSSFSADGKRAVVTVESDRNPGDYYLLDLDTHRASYLLSANHRLDPRQMRTMQPLAIKARDGLPLHGFITLPAGKPPYPMLVIVHGGPFGILDSWTFDAETQLFAAHGYAVLQVNYRGSGGYGADFVARGYRQWGQAMQDDLVDATQWAVQQGDADPRLICIYGASYGGFAAMEASVRDPDLYRCAIGYAGAYDLRVQWDKSDVQESNLGVAYMRETMGDDPATLLAHSPLAGVERIKADLLLIHGGADKRVPFANFREFTGALDRQHKPYETLVEPHEGHGFFVEAHRVEAYRKMVDFLDRHIGASVGPLAGGGSATSTATGR
jgi:dipeptidyl aminopeptidase/acylaminoacyl peptidase